MSVATKEKLAGIQLRCYEPEDENRIVSVLNASFPHGWNTEQYWHWKHLERPGFEERDIIVAQVNGETVACFHSAPLPLQLEPGLVVMMSFDGDFAVVPEYRGTGIPRHAHDLMDERLIERGVVLRGGFTSRELNEWFYRPQFGYVFVPTDRMNFRKVLGIRSLANKVESLGQRYLADPALRDAFARRPMIINFTVDTLPRFHLNLSGDAFRLVRGSHNDPHMHVKAPYAVLMSLSMGGRPFLRSVLANLIALKLRVTGLHRVQTSLLKLLWAAIKRR